MADIQAPPAHRTLAAELRWVRANLPADTPQSVTRALDAAAVRAETETDQARIWRGEAEQRETAVAGIERVHAELDRLTRLLPDPRGPGAQYAEGASWVLEQLREALDTDQAATTAATTKEP